jgi:hypothetical protein
MMLVVEMYIVYSVVYRSVEELVFLHFQAQMKLKAWDTALASLKQVLKIEPNNEKALFRSLSACSLIIKRVLADHYARVR